MGTTRSRFAHCASAAIIATGLAFAAAVAAQTPAKQDSTQVYTFEINPGSAAQVLTQLGTQIGVPIVFDPVVVKGVRSPGVKGAMTLANALAAALKGTGLRPVQTADGVIAIRPAEEIHRAQEGNYEVYRGNDAELAPVIIIVADQFAAESTDSATRTATPIKDIPQSVTVVSNAIMKSQQVQTVSDVLQNVSGVALGSSGSANIRGFQANVAIDGLRDNTSFSNPNGGINTPVIAVQQVEILKGPDSIISGSMQPGGVINVVKKVPQLQDSMEFALQEATDNHILVSADVDGRLLASNDHLAYRLIGSGEYADRLPLGYGPYRNNFLSGQLGWDSAMTKLVVGTEYIGQRTPTDIYTLSNQGTIVPYDHPITNPEDHLSISGETFSYDFIQKLFGTLAFHSKASYSTGRLTTEFYAIEDSSRFPTLFYLPFYSAIDAHGFNVDGNLTGSFKLGPLSQTLLAGYSYQKGSLTETLQVGAPAFRSIYHPNLPAARYNPARRSFNQDVGDILSAQIYFQDQLSWGPVHLQGNIARASDHSLFIDAQKWLPSFGAVYAISKTVSVYASRQRSYSAQANTPLANGTLPPPAEGTQEEVGTKLTFFGGKLTTTAALFKTRATDQALFDPAQGGYVLGGGGETKGFEADVQGEILSGLNMISSFAHAKFEPGPGSFSLVPRNRYTLWATYQIQSGKVRGLGFGGGLFGRDHYLAEDSASVRTRVPAQVRTDLSLFYKWKTLSATLGIKNVFDERLYGDFTYNSQVPVLPRRNFILTLETKF